MIRRLPPAVTSLPAGPAKPAAPLAPTAPKARAGPFEASPAATAAVDPKPLAQVQGSLIDAAKGLVGKGGWSQTILERAHESDPHSTYYRKYDDLEGSFPSWLKSADPVHTVPNSLNCIDLLFVTGVHARALTPAQAQALQDGSLAAAQLGGVRAHDRVGDLPRYTPDVAESARSAFIFDALGYSCAKEVEPDAPLKTGDVVFFGMPGDHVAIATGNGREVVSLWNRSSPSTTGQPVELTTVDALVEHLVYSVREPTAEELKHVPNPDRFRTDHLPPRWAAPGVPHVRAASNPLYDLGRAELPADSASWKATARIVGDDGLKQLLDTLRAKLTG